ncbi:hypothetical protein IWW37_000820 [Coemansia sp. RSA 2050]|nr:hypothetical protein IWW37_000820 [Coemansia sp. RSA 2050]
MSSRFVEHFDFDSQEDVDIFVNTNPTPCTIIVYAETRKYGMEFVEVLANKEFNGLIGLAYVKDSNKQYIMDTLTANNVTSKYRLKIFANNIEEDHPVLKERLDYIKSEDFALILSLD